MPLKITIPATNDLWDEKAQKFISVKETTVVLEHSLVSISKWESKWKRAFLSPKPMTDEQILDYIQRCMVIGGNNIDPLVFMSLPMYPDLVSQIKDYMEDPMSAAIFNDRMTANQSYKKRSIVSEEIYYIMASNNISIEFQKWHLNRLLSLLKMFEVKNTPPKKMSKRDIMSNYAQINQMNRAKYHTKG